jgi:deoxyribodipyrimidine photo-lyase
VDPTVAARAARERLWARRQGQAFRELADGIQQKHGSRRSGLAANGAARRRRSKAATRADDGTVQLGLDLQLG